MKLPIYLDYSATTPVDHRVAEKMMKYLTIDGIFGNPISRSYCYGWQAEESVDIARNHVASLVGADPREIVFTSGATESNNLALKGTAYASHAKKRHIITAVTEHKAVINTCQKLENEGYSLTWLVPPENGIITPKQLSNAFRDETILVSLMHVNNETGVIQDIMAFGKLCRAHGALFHVDAAQSIGKLPINLEILPVDLMSFSAHKIYGPKGIGALFIRRRTPSIHLEPQIHGGGQEYGIRSGTLAVHQIVGMGEAYYIAGKVFEDEVPRQQFLRDKLWKGLQKIEGVFINGDLKQSVATVLNVGFFDVNGEDLITAAKDLAISTGSACSSTHLDPSYVLRAMGLSFDLAKSSIRFSLGRYTTQKEIEYTINKVQITVEQLREMFLR